jgi:hypothetical protein
MLRRHMPLVAFPLLSAGCGVYEGSVQAPGDPRARDALAILPEVKAFAGEDACLVSAEAQYVRSDGTIDMKASYVPAYADVIAYEFVVPFEPPSPDRSLPIGVRPPVSTETVASVEVRITNPQLVDAGGTWGGTTTHDPRRHRGMLRREGVREPKPHRVVPPPRCTLAGLWAEAIRHGAPADAVATIRYDWRGYRLQILHTEHDLRFDDACRVMPADTEPGPARDWSEVREALRNRNERSSEYRAAVAASCSSAVLSAAAYDDDDWRE